MRTLGAVALVAVMVMSASPTSSQDATVAAPNNYKVEFENELVRVVRVTYGPHEKSPMHGHQGTPTVIVVLREGGQMHFVNEDGTTSEGRQEKAGSVRFVPARKPFKHQGENVADTSLETIRVELKTPLQAVGDCRQK